MVQDGPECGPGTYDGTQCECKLPQPVRPVASRIYADGGQRLRTEARRRPALSRPRFCLWPDRRQLHRPCPRQWLATYERLRGHPGYYQPDLGSTDTHDTGAYTQSEDRPDGQPDGEPLKEHTVYVCRNPHHAEWYIHHDHPVAQERLRGYGQRGQRLPLVCI